MNVEKNVYRGLKIVFSILIGLMVIAALGMVMATVLINIPSIHDQIVTLTPSEAASVTGYFAWFSSPLIMIASFAGIVLNIVLFYFIRRFFKNLEMDRIFVTENVLTAKKVAALLLVMSFVAGLPDLIASLQGLATDGFSWDLTYVIGASIVWALAKILERANLIAEENELTI